MSKFKLKEATVTVRDEEVRIRELTHAERLEWFKVLAEDRTRSLASLVSLGALDPTYTEEEAGALPGEVCTLLYNEVLKLSNLAKVEPEPEKKADAGGAVSLPAGSGVASPAE